MLRVALSVLSLCGSVASPAKGCDVALLLAIDVSGSVDGAEYRLQVDGLADALLDPVIADTLVEGQMALSAIQWSAAGMQTVTLPWKRMLDASAVTDFAAAARAQPRAFDGADTAVGDAIAFAVKQFAAVPDCQRLVIDISGDGAVNAGSPVPPARGAAIAAGIEINAIAIEEIGVAITEFYRRFVITRNGFAMTAQGHLDYPRAIREKILREIEKPAS